MAAVLMGGEEAVFLVLVTVGGMTLAWKLLGPLAQALARRIEGRSTRSSEVELEELRGRLGELEAQQARLYELEERLEFAERLLVRERAEPGRLPAGGERQ